jgi:hypothetical protein
MSTTNAPTEDYQLRITLRGIMGALARAQDRIEFIQVRHEEMVAFMACGHAKFTGGPPDRIGT